MPEITVVITAYKLAKFLPLCFEDLLGQSFQDFNILVVDDCSPDETANIIRQHEIQYPDKIHAIYLSKNMGSPAKTRNCAMNSGLIKGRYVIFLDGDDRIESDFLAKLYDKARKTDADITICAYDRIEAKTGHLLCKEMQGFPPTLSLSSAGDTLAFINTSLWNKLIRTSCIGDIRIPDFMVGEDLAFLFRLYSICKKISFVDDILIHYQVRHASVISSTSEDTIHSFAAELKSQLDSCNDDRFKNVLKLTTFIHIGISMALRAKDNPAIDMHSHLKWTREYLKSNGLLKSEGYLSLVVLARRGIKGMGVWACHLLYRVHAINIFLKTYTMLTKMLHIDIKF